MKYRTYVLILTIGSVLFIEIFLRIKGNQNTYSESIGQKYSSYYNKVLPSWYHRWIPNDSFLLDHGDFKFPYRINSLGLREKEVEKNKPDSVFRIITMGDSYTEGVGAPYDSSWPRLLEKYIIAKQQVQIINAGESGSDPFYDYTFYRDKLQDYKHSMLIAAFNSSDFSDYILRGGLERFQPDGTTQFRKGPWYEPLYHYSHFFRAVLNKLLRFPYKGIFVSQSESIKKTNEAILQYTALFDSLNSIAMKDSAQLVVLFYPTPTEIIFDSETNQRTKEAMRKIELGLNKKGIYSINMWDDFKREFGTKPELSYTYQNDKHFNAYGYNIMSKLVAEKINNQNTVIISK